MRNCAYRYLLGGAINLNNRDSEIAFGAAETIEFLRQQHLNTYKWEGELVFFPNCYYSKRTVFENMRNRNLYTNRDINPSLFAGFNFTKIQCPSQMDTSSPSFLMWHGELPDGVQLSDSVYLLRVLDGDNVNVGKCNAFCCKLADGVSVLGFILGDLTPVFVGSGTATVTGRHSLQELGDFCQIFECGTGNTPLLLHLYDISD